MAISGSKGIKLLGLCRRSKSTTIKTSLSVYSYSTIV